jgi:hypothetical protein
MAESEYEHFGVDTSDGESFTAFVVVNATSNQIVINEPKSWRIDDWLEQERYSRARAWVVFVIAMLLVMFGIALLNAQDAFEQSDRAKVLHALDRGEWSEAVRSESLNYDTMPEETEAFKAEQEYRQLKSDVAELKKQVATLLAERVKK